MRIDKSKITEENIEEPLKVDASDAVDPDGLLAQKLADDLKQQEESGTSEPAVEEYEYVDVKDATGGVIGKLKEIVKEYAVVFLCAALILIGGLIILIAQNASTLFLAVVFGIVALIGVVLIYMAWQEKKEADRAYRHAVEVIEPVKKKMNENATSRKSKGGKSSNSK